MTQLEVGKVFAEFAANIDKLPASEGLNATFVKHIRAAVDRLSTRVSEINIKTPDQDVYRIMETFLSLNQVIANATKGTLQFLDPNFQPFCIEGDYSHSGKLYLVGSVQDGNTRESSTSMHLIDFNTGELVESPQGIKIKNFKLLFNSGPYLIASADKQDFIFDLSQGTFTQAEVSKVSYVKNSSTGPNGQAFTYVNQGDSWHILNLNTGKIIDLPKELRCNTEQAFYYGSDGSTYALLTGKGSHNPNNFLVNLDSGQEVKLSGSNGKGVLKVVPSHAKDKLYVIPNDFPAKAIYDAKTGEAIIHNPKHKVLSYQSEIFAGLNGRDYIHVNVEGLDGSQLLCLNDGKLVEAKAGEITNCGEPQLGPTKGQAYARVYVAGNSTPQVLNINSRELVKTEKALESVGNLFFYSDGSSYANVVFSGGEKALLNIADGKQLVTNDGTKILSMDLAYESKKGQRFAAIKTSTGSALLNLKRLTATPTPIIDKKQDLQHSFFSTKDGQVFCSLLSRPNGLEYVRGLVNLTTGQQIEYKDSVFDCVADASGRVFGKQSAANDKYVLVDVLTGEVISRIKDKSIYDLKQLKVDGDGHVYAKFGSKVVDISREGFMSTKQHVHVLEKAHLRLLPNGEPYIQPRDKTGIFPLINDIS